MNKQYLNSWFKEVMSLSKDIYEVKYSSHLGGDLGSLYRIEFNSEIQGGNIELWSLGYLGIHLVDYTSGVEKMNVLIEPAMDVEKKRNLESLRDAILS